MAGNVSGQMLPVPEDVEILPVVIFIGDVLSNYITDDDGSGYYSDGSYYSWENLAIPSVIAKNGPDARFTHVVWFNK